jgi:hypothetical protein
MRASVIEAHWRASVIQPRSRPARVELHASIHETAQRRSDTGARAVERGLFVIGAGVVVRLISPITVRASDAKHLWNPDVRLRVLARRGKRIIASIPNKDLATASRHDRKGITARSRGLAGVTALGPTAVRPATCEIGSSRWIRCRSFFRLPVPIASVAQGCFSGVMT